MGKGFEYTFLVSCFQLIKETLKGNELNAKPSFVFFWIKTHKDTTDYQNNNVGICQLKLTFYGKNKKINKWGRNNQNLNLKSINYQRKLENVENIYKI